MNKGIEKIIKKIEELIEYINKYMVEERDIENERYLLNAKVDIMRAKERLERT